MEYIVVDDDTMTWTNKHTLYKCINKSGILMVYGDGKIIYIQDDCTKHKELTDVIIKHYPTFIKRLLVCVYIITIYSVWIQLMI